MEMVKAYIVLYKDGSMMFFRSLPDKSHHQDGAKFFETFDEIYLYNIMNWAAIGFNTENNHLIKEITGDFD